MAVSSRTRKRSSRTSCYTVDAVLATILIGVVAISLRTAQLSPLSLPVPVALAPSITKTPSSLPSTTASPSTQQSSLLAEDRATEELTRLLRSPAAQILQRNFSTSNRYVLLRALGNDLPPRHAVGQTYSNVKFVLDHEDPNLHQLSRHWYINRIVDPEEELRLVRLLVEKRENFTRDPVDFDAYAKVDLNFNNGRDPFHSNSFRELGLNQRANVLNSFLMDKNQFLIHNNQARNAMLDLGKRSGATYILPWDGNCFLNKRAWHEIRTDIHVVEQAIASDDTKKSTFKYFAVDMVRMTNNSLLKDPEYAPPVAFEEPQLIFHKSARERFNEKMPYGQRPKVELLWRLRVKGAWDKWSPRSGPWGDDGREYSDDVPGPDSVIRVGWVARLFSGNRELELKGAAVARGHSRADGVEILSARATQIWARRKLGFGESTLLLYNESVLLSNRQSYHRGDDPTLNKLVKHLVSLADAELRNNAVYTVTDKPKSAPSGDMHDYFSAAPYYWPNPSTQGGISDTRRDGERARGMNLYGEKSEMYDRTRWASFSRNATVLTLAGYFTGERRFYKKAARQVRTWFLDEDTRMNPNMNFAQMSSQDWKSKGSPTGLIDFVNLAVILDTVRILGKEKVLSSEDMQALKEWMQEYALFLSNSTKAADEYYSNNNHGTLFDVQAASVYAFIGDFHQLLRHTNLARLRMSGQFAMDGSMPHEMKRKTQLHHMMYALQAWVWLARISDRIGVDMWEFGAKGTGEGFLQRGLKFCVPYFNGPLWGHRQAGTEDMERMIFLYFNGREKYPHMHRFVEQGQLDKFVLRVPQSMFGAKAVFHDYYLIPPFWNLGMHPTNLDDQADVFRRRY